MINKDLGGSTQVPCGTATVERGRITWADAAFCAILGYPVEASATTEGVVGLELSSLYTTPAGLAEFVEAVRSALEGQQACVITSWCRHDGTVAEVVVNVAVEEQDSDRWAITVCDTTSFHKQLRLANRPDQTFDAILHHSPIGFGLMILDPSGNRVMGWYNPAMGRIFGYDETALRGLSTRVLYPDEASFLSSGAQIKQQIAERGVCDFTPIMMRQDGTLIDVRVIIVPVRLDNEVSLLTIVDDITDRKLAEQELKQSEARLNTILKSAPLGIAILRDRKVRWCNEELVQLFGYPASEIIGQDTRLFHIDDEAYKRSGSEFYGSLLQGGLGATEVVLHRKDGTPLNVLVRGTLFDADQDHPEVIISAVDLTGMRRAEAEKTELERQIHELQKLEGLGQLAGGVAHDFNNLLVGVLGYGELLSMALDKTPEIKVYAEAIVEAAQSAASLTQNLLSFARRGLNVFEVIDLKELLQQSIELLRQSIDPKIAIKERLEATRTEVVGDRSHLQSAIINLALNARDAMHDGGTLEISSKVVQLKAEAAKSRRPPLMPGEYLQISVSDTGKGIPPELATRIFEPFFTTKEVGKGTGLGLSAVYGTMRQHGGDVSFHSGARGGTVFELLLPLADREESQRSSSNRPAVAHQGSGCVLVIDDEKIVRETARLILQRHGYEVLTAASGREGLESFANNRARIDLVLLDIMMPQMDGKQTYAQLRLQDPTVRVLICTGYSHDVRVDDLLEQGALGVLLKPFRLAELVERVAGYIGNKREERDPAS